ncbi:MAG: hypothetical protein RIF37_09830 [Rhodospirillaceae bacterium]
MAERFPEGSTAYTKDGRAYTVDEVADGTVYCSLPNGTETDFPETALLNEQEWGARSGGQEDVVYGRIKRAKEYAAPELKLNPRDAEKVLLRADKIRAGLLDFAAYTIGVWCLKDAGQSDQADSLSIIKCRAVFESHSPEARASALAKFLGAKPNVLVSMAELGDNLVRAMIDQGMAGHEVAYEEFCDRPRR